MVCGHGAREFEGVEGDVVQGYGDGPVVGWETVGLSSQLAGDEMGVKIGHGGAVSVGAYAGVRMASLSLVKG